MTLSLAMTAPEVDKSSPSVIPARADAPPATSSDSVAAAESSPKTAFPSSATEGSVHDEGESSSQVESPLATPFKPTKRTNVEDLRKGLSALGLDIKGKKESLYKLVWPALAVV